MKISRRDLWSFLLLTLLPAGSFAQAQGSSRLLSSISPSFTSQTPRSSKVTNKICYFEIGCRDRAKTADFYSKLFEWKMQPEAGMTRIKTGDDINGHITSLGHEPHHYAIFYVMVDDVGTALTKA